MDKEITDKLFELINKHNNQFSMEDLKWKTKGRDWYWFLEKINDVSFDFFNMEKEDFYPEIIEIMTLFLELINNKLKEVE